MDPQTSEQRRLVRRLHHRRREAKVVQFEDVIIGDWKPVAQWCHENVRRWVEANADCKPVRGWLYFRFSWDGCPQFLAHSVVERTDGSLMDITPSQASMRYPFIRHQGTLEDFDRLVAEWSMVRLNYRP
jgi:hypothetical protein